MPDAPTAGGHITLPGGLKVKKNVAIGIGVGAVVVAGVIYYRNKQQTAAADTTGTYGSGIDPQTGYAYGSPEDQAALAALSSGTTGQLDSASYVGGQTIGYDQYGNPVYGQGQGGLPGAFTNNAQWTQAAESYMGSDGNDAIAAALGKYITGQDLQADQVTVVQSAIASQGYPPIAGPAGFPPSYHTAGNPTQTPPPTAAPPAVNPVKGLHAVPRFTQIDVHWEPLTNATSYQVTLYKGTAQVTRIQTKGTFYTFHDLHKNTQYRVTVWGKPGKGSTASTTVKTQ
jgi:hypothetical protein